MADLQAKTEKTFTIRWSADLGEAWMNEDNLLTCLRAYCKSIDFEVEEAETEQIRAGKITTMGY